MCATKRTFVRQFLLLNILILVVGCGSTPYKDDYTKHINIVGTSFAEQGPFTLSFEQGDGVDLRGIYHNNDEVAQSAILYQGGAGLVGLFAQIGTHATLINSSRNEKLAQAQVEANQHIQPLLDQVQSMSLPSLLDSYASNIVTIEQQNANTLRTRPMFFSNTDMNQLMLKLVVWIPDPKGKKDTFIYQNMVQVYALAFDEVEKQRVLANKDGVLAQTLSRMLKTGVNIVLNDVNGVYAKSKSKQQSFFIEQNNKKKVIRGAIVEERCDYRVVRDLHAWFIALPHEPENTLTVCNTNDIK